MNAMDAVAVFADLTPDEQAEAMKMLDGLIRSGYRTVDEHKGLRPGTRVRHRSHQYPEAYANGTGVVWTVVEKNPSSWSESWGAPDVELVVVCDRESFGGRLSQVAQYHVEVVEVAS